MTGEQAGRLVAVLSAAYPRADFSTATVEVYVGMLRPYDYDVVERAVRSSIDSSVYLPTVAEIRSAIATEAVGAPAPALAWEQAQKRAAWEPSAVRCSDCDGSGYQDVDADVVCPECHGTGDARPHYTAALHPLAERAAENVGGWYSIRNSERPGLARRDFLAAYSELVRDALRDATDRAALPSRPALEVVT